MAKSSEEMDKLQRRSSTGTVLVAIELSKSRANLGEGPSEATPEVDPPQYTASDYDVCVARLKALDDRLKTRVTAEDQNDKVVRTALGHYLKLRPQVKAAMQLMNRDPKLVLDDIAQLGRLFRQAWETVGAARQVERREGAQAELVQLRQQESDAAAHSQATFKIAERARLFDVERTLKQKQTQLLDLKQNLLKETVHKKRQDYEKRIATAETERDVEQQKLDAMTNLKTDLEQAQQAHEALKQKVKDGQQRCDDLAQQQSKLEKELQDRAADLHERCEGIAKDSPLPKPIATTLQAVEALINEPNFAKAQSALEDLQDLLDAEEARLQQSYPERESVLESLESLEEQIQQLDDEPLASEDDRTALAQMLGAARTGTQERRYADAATQAQILAVRLSEALARVEQLQLEKDAFDTALTDALAEIEDYKSRTVDPEELRQMTDLVKAANLQAKSDFAAALKIITDKLAPKIQKFLADQAKWQGGSPKVRPPRQPPAPPNYAQAAARVVRDVLALFNRAFDYAGPSLDLSGLYPRDRYDPGRLKRAVRSEFDKLVPSTALPDLTLSAKCYFNLGAGGTTKKKYEYNVKVKRPGEPRALAQIHIVYS